MIKSYFKTAWRSLWRSKAFTVINMLGLSLGITVFLLIMEYVAFEWGANRFNTNYKQIYRASISYKEGNSENYLAPGIGKRIGSSFPAITKMARVAEGVGSGIVNIPDARGVADSKSFREDQVSFVDADFFNIFSFPLVSGSKTLDAPQTMAISKSTALKYFESDDAVGKTVQLSNQFGTFPYTITAVFSDMPQQSDIKADILLSFKTLENPAMRAGNDWADPDNTGSAYTAVYYLLQQNANADQLAERATILTHQLNKDTKTGTLMLQPMKYLHLAPSFDYKLQTFGSLTLVVLFLSVGVLIMIVAWVNYINLSTAQALTRAREAGIRKVIGATRGQLIIQYLSETFLLVMISVAVAFVAVSTLQNTYNTFLGKQLAISQLNNVVFLTIGIAMLFIGTLFSGGYVAFVLSSYSPLKTLRAKTRVAVSGVSLRRGLVVFQFTTSIVFIIATIILYRQLQFMQHQDLGMQLDKRVVITGPAIQNSSKALHTKAFENELGQLPFIKKLAASSNVPGKGYNFTTEGITRNSAAQGDEKKSYAMLIVGDHYFDTYSIKMIAGNTFTSEALEQGWRKTKKVILNQAAVQQLGFKPGENVVGQTIQWGDAYEIVGVIKDYHHLSLHDLIKPMIFLPAVSSGYFTLQMNNTDLNAHIAQIRKIYQSNFPGEPFTWSFIDEVYDKQYQAEQQLGSGFIISAGIAVFIACLGLFGLVAFTVKQKIKEIGIRKVLGASVLNISTLISKDFIMLVVISLVIATPVAWYVMNKWLQSFAYRISIEWWMFALAGALAILIAYITVGFQSVKAAMANPVKSLRSE